MRIIITLVFAITLTACTPAELPYNAREQSVNHSDCCIIASDGEKLHVKKWLSDSPKAIIIALHGYNDYSHSFKLMGEALKDQNISTIAYDHRGFGQNKYPGIWPGHDNLVQDAYDVVYITYQEYPNIPIYLLGSSMGGAVAIELLYHHPNVPIEGVILNSPAIWGGKNMDAFGRTALWTAAHIIPSHSFTGEDLKIKPTDNIEVMKEMSKDPYVIKKSRVDSIHGLVELMHDVHIRKPVKNTPTLLLYGLKDEVIPPGPIYQFAKTLPENNIRIYDEGYHMLLRDQQRAKVFADITNWILHDEPSTSE